MLDHFRWPLIEKSSGLLADYAFKTCDRESISADPWLNRIYSCSVCSIQFIYRTSWAESAQPLKRNAKVFLLFFQPHHFYFLLWVSIKGPVRPFTRCKILTINAFWDPSSDKKHWNCLQESASLSVRIKIIFLPAMAAGYNNSWIIFLPRKRSG
jgi:hypothetical protein